MLAVESRSLGEKLLVRIVGEAGILADYDGHGGVLDEVLEFGVNQDEDGARILELVEDVLGLQASVDRYNHGLQGWDGLQGVANERDVGP